jgi:hypothetical protein
MELEILDNTIGSLFQNKGRWQNRSQWNMLEITYWASNSVKSDAIHNSL